MAARMNNGEKEFDCKGMKCDSMVECLQKGECCYRSSADEARDTMRIEGKVTGSIVSTSLDVADFVGKIDGKGVKGVMVSPKTGVQMIAPQFIEGVGDVLTYGAQKYAPNNWMRGMSWSVVFGGILRHLFAWFRGEDIDLKEKGGSGLPHLLHAACGLMFLYYYTTRPEHKQFDDRVFK